MVKPRKKSPQEIEQARMNKYGPDLDFLKRHHVNPDVIESTERKIKTASQYDMGGVAGHIEALKRRVALAQLAGLPLNAENMGKFLHELEKAGKQRLAEQFPIEADRIKFINIDTEARKLQKLPANEAERREWLQKTINRQHTSAISSISGAIGELALLGVPNEISMKFVKELREGKINPELALKRILELKDTAIVAKFTGLPLNEETLNKDFYEVNRIGLSKLAKDAGLDPRKARPHFIFELKDFDISEAKRLEWIREMVAKDEKHIKRLKVDRRHHRSAERSYERQKAFVPMETKQAELARMVVGRILSEGRTPTRKMLQLEIGKITNAVFEEIAEGLKDKYTRENWINFYNTYGKFLRKSREEE